MDSPRFACALSVEADSAKAEAETLATLQAALGPLPPDLLMVFVSHHHGGAIEELGGRLARATRAKVVLGCTGESIIGGSREIEREPALALWAARLPGTRITPFSVEAAAGPDGEVVFSGMPEVTDRERASLILLADPFSFPMDAYLGRLNDELPGVPAVGGMASGGMGPGQNLLITAEGLVTAGALGCVLEGEIEVRSVVSQGCRPVGKPWVVTACDEQEILKLGGEPAVNVLIQTMQDLEPTDRECFQRQPFIGLAIDASRASFERSDFLVRGILRLDQKTRGLTVADLVRRGMTVQFLMRDAASASEDLGELMRTALLETSGTQEGSGALIFSCNGRGTRLFSQPDHDVTRVRESLDAEVPLAGFFAAGEIGPVGGRNFLHGFTASVVLFRERTGS